MAINTTILDTLNRAHDTLTDAHRKGESGVTHYLHGEHTAARYIVGGLVPSRIIWANEMSEDMIARVVLAIVGDAMFHDEVMETLGYWTDEGRVHFDAGDTWNNLGYALSEARDRGELAIWDRIEGKEIRVN